MSNTTLRILSVKEGGGVPPKSITFFFGPTSGVFEQKTQFLAPFEEKFPVKKSVKGGRGAQWANLRGQAMQLDITLHCDDLR